MNIEVSGYRLLAYNILGIFPEINPDKSQPFHVPEDKLKILIRRMFYNLMWKDGEIMSLLYGFENEPKSLKEIGDMFGTSPERIKQIKAKTMRSLKHYSRKRELEDAFAGKTTPGERQINF